MLARLRAALRLALARALLRSADRLLRPAAGRTVAPRGTSELPSAGDDALAEPERERGPPMVDAPRPWLARLREGAFRIALGVPQTDRRVREAAGHDASSAHEMLESLSQRLDLARRQLDDLAGKAERETRTRTRSEPRWAEEVRARARPVLGLEQPSAESARAPAGPPAEPVGEPGTPPAPRAPAARASSLAEPLPVRSASPVRSTGEVTSSTPPRRSMPRSPLEAETPATTAGPSSTRYAETGEQDLARGAASSIRATARPMTSGAPIGEPVREQAGRPPAPRSSGARERHAGSEERSSVRGNKHAAPEQRIRERGRQTPRSDHDGRLHPRPRADAREAVRRQPPRPARTEAPARVRSERAPPRRTGELPQRRTPSSGAAEARAPAFATVSSPAAASTWPSLPDEAPAAPSEPGAEPSLWPSLPDDPVTARAVAETDTRVRDALRQGSLEREQRGEPWNA